MRAPLLSVPFALLVGGCTIQRDVPLEAYACSNGGPCEDGGIKMPPDDAGVEPDDAGFKQGDAAPDAGPPDTGSPLPACFGIQPLPENGLATGDSSGEVNSYEGECSRPGGRDLVYGFVAPGRLSSLNVSLNGSDFDTALHIYRTDCNPSSRVTCNDDEETWNQFLQRTSAARLEDLPAGGYAIVIDAFGDMEAGTYVLSVRGRIPPGEPCDPNVSFLACDLGACADDGSGRFRCPEALDCEDGVDADDDGLVDEDASKCADPPSVTCLDVAPPAINMPVDLTATVFDDGTITDRRWRVMEQPVGSLEEIYDPTEEASFMFTDLVGDYRVRYRAADDRLQLSACEISFRPVVPDDLRVELIWNSDGPHHEHHSSLVLHLLHPSAGAWFEPTLDCYANGCFDGMIDWGQQNEPQDDPIAYGLIMGPNFTTLPEAQDQAPYGVGVSYDWFGFRDVTTATVAIYCRGDLAATLGPQDLVNGAGFPDDNDFWKVAEVELDGSGCQVTPFDDPDPVIVTGFEASTMR